MKHYHIIVVLILCIISLPYMARAAGMTQPFGGKVLSIRIPSVTCIGTGTGPVVLASNLAAGLSTLQGGSVSNIVSNVYGVIPLYTTSPTKKPQVTQWVLGRHDLIPNLSTCSMGSVPFPVKKTTNYGVSGGSYGL